MLSEISSFTKKIDHKLKENKKQSLFKYIFDQLDQAILCMNSACQIEYANIAASILTEYSIVEINNLQVQTLFKKNNDLDLLGSFENNGLDREKNSAPTSMAPST